MKKWILAGIGSVLGIIILLIITYVAIIIYINWPDDKTIIKNLEVTQEWTEIAVKPSVKPTNQVQYINLRINDFRVDRNAKGSEIKLPDGRIVKPEIELYDEFGDKFEFHHSGFVMKTFDDMAFSPGTRDKSVKLPSDRQYTKMRIRSEVPFKCDQIYWRDHNLK